MSNVREIESFLKRLNLEPPKDSVKEMPKSNFNPTAYNYVPISHVQTTLDELFFGLWSTENFKATVVANELVGQVDLKVFHPVAKTWITRTGFASVAIQQNRGATVTQIEEKKKKALELDAPKLLTECIKNAAKHLGNIFGRNLNRKSNTVDTYKAIVTMQDAKKQKSIEASSAEVVEVVEETIQRKIESCKTIDDLALLYETEVNNLTSEDKKAFTAKKLKIQRNGGK